MCAHVGVHCIDARNTQVCLLRHLLANIRCRQSLVLAALVGAWFPPPGFNLHYLNAEHLPKCELVTWLVPFAEGVFTSFAHLKTLVLFSSSCD